MRRLTWLTLLLAGCGPVNDGPPLPTGRCEPSGGAVEIGQIEILGDMPPHLALDDGATLPLFFGGQGAEMTVFRIAFAGPMLPECVPFAVVARDLDGVTNLELDTALRLEPIGPLWATEPLSAIRPGDIIEVEVTAGASALRRSFAVGGLRVGLEITGAEQLGVDETTSLRVAISGRAIEPVQIDLDAFPAGLLEVPASVVVEPGSVSVDVDVRGVAEGSAHVRARLDEYESPAFSVSVETAP